MDPAESVPTLPSAESAECRHATSAAFSSTTTAKGQARRKLGLLELGVA